MSQDKDIIERSAADSAKGSRLQRLRAALFLLEATASDDLIQAYAAVEAEGDAFISTSTATAASAYSEEDKNYDPERSLTLVSHAVLNTLVIFADQWLRWHCSSSLRFGLYATTPIGKEKNVGRVITLGLTLPERPILECLRAHDFSDSNVLPCLKALVLDEYRRQYQTAGKAGHLSTLQEWADSTWLSFLSVISWLFGEKDVAAAEKTVATAIKASRFYTELHDGKEDLVASALVDLLDHRQGAADYAHRFVHAADIELLFKKVASGEIRGADPMWQAWDGVPAPQDTRNIREKLLAICPNLSKAALARYQRQTSMGLLELDAYAQDKTVRAIRFHIYDACETALGTLSLRRQLTEAELQEEIDRLVETATARVLDQAKVYRYANSTASFVRGLVLELFDSCFLSFEADDE